MWFAACEPQHCNHLLQRQGVYPTCPSVAYYRHDLLAACRCHSRYLVPGVMLRGAARIGRVEHYAFTNDYPGLPAFHTAADTYAIAALFALEENFLARVAIANNYAFANLTPSSTDIRIGTTEQHSAYLEPRLEERIRAHACVVVYRA